MQRPINRRRFLELSATVTSLTEVGGALDNFSPQLSEIAFAPPILCDAYNDNSTITNWTDAFFNKENYDSMIYNNHSSEMVLINDHAVEPT